MNQLFLTSVGLRRCYMESTSSQDIFWAITSLVSCTGVTEKYVCIPVELVQQAYVYPCICISLHMYLLAYVAARVHKNKLLEEELATPPEAHGLVNCTKNRTPGYVL